MKTLTAKSYRYVGIKDGWHVFECTKSDFDREMLLLERARMIMEDGTSVFYDPVCPTSALSVEFLKPDVIARNERMKAYAKAVYDSASVKSRPNLGHNPKRNVAGSNEPVRNVRLAINKVSLSGPVACSAR